MQITTEASHLLSGVSQQPLAIRLPSQASRQVNAYPSLVDGLIKRHPTQHLAKIISGSAGDVYLHRINRDTAERYCVVISASSVKVFDSATGASVFVKDSTGGYPYLAGAAPGSDFKAVTIADYTFIVNTAKIVTMDTPTTAADTSVGHAFVFVRQGVIKKNYTIKITRGATTETATTQTWDGVAAGVGELASIKTDDIAADLATKINAWATLASITATTQGSVIEITDGSAFDRIEVTDSNGDSMLVKMHKDVPRYTDLPLICRDGWKIKVSGDANKVEDDYWIKFVADTAGAFGKGKWEETVAYSTPYLLKASTMPHILVRKTDDGIGTVTGTPNAKYFEFSTAPWDQRLVGDTASNPDPSFVGSTINDLSFFKDRLILLADDNEIGSEQSGFFNFFRTTVLDLLDTDPYDIAPGHQAVSILQWAIPYNERLITFSDRTQFSTPVDSSLTPKTASITPVSEYECSPGAKPVSTGRSIFFPFKRGNYSGIRELFPNSDTGAFEALDVTIHVPKYLSGTVTKLAVSTLEDVLIVLTDDNPHGLYVYKYAFNGSERIQSAWFEYDFGSASVLDAEWIENTLYLVLQRQDGVYLEKSIISNGVVDDGAPYLTCLDRRITDVGLSKVFNAITQETTVSLPYQIDTGATMSVVTRYDTPATGGVKAQVVSVDTSTATHKLVLRGDYSTTPFWVGQVYTMTHELPPPILRGQSQDGGLGPMSATDVMVQFGYLNFQDSYHFTVQAGDYSSVWNGPLLGFPGSTVGAVTLKTGVHRFPVRARPHDVTITITNASALPSNLVSIEWTLNITSRARRFHG